MNDWTAARKSASLVMYDTSGSPVARYHLENAWPAKVEIGGLRADASEVLMETPRSSTTTSSASRSREQRAKGSVRALRFPPMVRPVFAFSMTTR
jgi:hypothetical protein